MADNVRATDPAPKAAKMKAPAMNLKASFFGRPSAR
jgi:hypothetical protein